MDSESATDDEAGDDASEDGGETVAHVSLHGEGDWMHPPEDDEGSGYSQDPDDMTEEEIRAAIKRLEQRRRQRQETENDGTRNPND
jgi:hypothetical protein